MSLILCLETSTEAGSVALVEAGKVIISTRFQLANSHSQLMAVMVAQVMELTGRTLPQVDALALSAGPGSYTGLRIGASLAKGICFGLGKPLIALDTLQMMAAQAAPVAALLDAYLCPMLDARRQEVYTAVYHQNLNTAVAPAPLVVEHGDIFQNLDLDKPVVYFGPGAAKCRAVLQPVWRFRYLEGIMPDAAAGAKLAEDAYQQGRFQDLARFEPDYLKAFQGTLPKAAPKI